MKIYIFLIVTAVLGYSVFAENCANVNDCFLTQCIQASHSHQACDKGHCTCKEEGKSCITIDDCNMDPHIRCIDSGGISNQKFHCLDSTCQCV